MVSIEQIAAASLQFKNQTGVEVTESAQDLMRVVLSAVEDDPHPGWKASPEELTKIAKDFLSNLPNYLRQIATTKGTQRLTTFHALHWLSVNLDRICPIQKG